MTKKLSMQELKQALLQVDLEWFTKPLKWELDRYVVAFTHNEADTPLETIIAQFRKYAKIFNNVNIWGWLDNATDKVYIDISTSFSNKKEAIKFGKIFNQIAIWDNVNMNEIRLV